MRGSLALRFRLLRYLAVGMLLFITIFIISLSVRITLWNQHHMDVQITDASTDISSYDMNSESPLPLNGSWECFSGVFFDDTASYDPSLFKDPTYIDLPISTLASSKGTATYRLRIKLPDNFKTNNAMLFIPNLQEHVQVFLNGVSLVPIQTDMGWAYSSKNESLFFLTSIDENLEYQELAISVNKNSSETALYGRTIMLGAKKDIITYIITSIVNEMFLLGAMMLILLNSFVFMLIRPNHTLISFITLFDTALILRITFGMRWVTVFLQNLFPSFYISDTLGVSGSIFFLMLAGVVGVNLSNMLFDPNQRIPKHLTTFTGVSYLIMAVVFPLFPVFFESYGIYLLMFVYLVTCITLILQFIVCFRERFTIYYMLQIVKTTYVGILLFFDIFGFIKNGSFLLFVYGYGIFFIIHIFMRLYDNNNSYKAVEQMNQTLENTVQERTLELIKANETLAEMTIRDPLTQAHNRFYFERKMEEWLTYPLCDNFSLYLAIFDLDFFKRINDNYGHIVGDEQLKYLVYTINNIIEDDTALARIGGEEFVLLFYCKTKDYVINTLEDIRLTLEGEANHNPQYTTASIGVTDYRSNDTMKSMLMRADEYLYEAKRTGRNRIVCGFETDAPQ